MKNIHGFMIHNWMIDKMKLSGSELIIYAFMYSQMNEFNEYTETLEYTAKHTGYSGYRAVIEVVNRLVKLGLLIKTDMTREHNRKTYKVNVKE